MFYVQSIFFPNIVLFIRECAKIWYSRSGHRCTLDN